MTEGVTVQVFDALEQFAPVQINEVALLVQLAVNVTLPPISVVIGYAVKEQTGVKMRTARGSVVAHCAEDAISAIT